MLCGEIDCGGPICGCDISLTVRGNNEEEKFCYLRDHLPAFLDRYQRNNTRRDFLRYPIQFPVQSNNNTMMPRLI
jgi:hypothetical protein